MFKTWKKYTFFILIALIIIILIWHHHNQRKVQVMSAFTPPPVAVRMAPAQSQKWPVILQGTGLVTAHNGVMIRAQVAGEILEQFVQPSSFVQAGAPLYQIDPQGLEQLIKQNEAEATLTYAQLREQQVLYKRGFVSKNEYDTAVANYKVAANTVQQNKHKLSLTRVAAPFSGKLGVMLVHKGDIVKVNDPLVSLQNSDQLRVDFTLPGNFAHLAQVGQTVEIEVLQYPHKIFKGQVTSVNASIDQATQSILVRAYLDKEASIITPGAFATVQLFIDRTYPVVTVPQTAVVYSDAGASVYRVVDGVAHIVPVTTGQRLGNQIAITSGLTSNMQVVSEGKVKLMDGDRVQISNTQ